MLHFIVYIGLTGEKRRGAKNLLGISLTPSQPEAADIVNDGPAPRDPKVEAEFLKRFFEFHMKATGEREQTAREALNKILSRSDEDFDIFGLYRGCCQRGGFHSREHAKQHMSFAEIFLEMNNHTPDRTYTNIGKRLLDAYEKFLLPLENMHPEDLNTDECLVCERKDGAMIQCDKCEIWTHEGCHRPGALQRIPIKFPDEQPPGADANGIATDDSDSDQANDLAKNAQKKKRRRHRLVFVCDSCAAIHLNDPDNPDAIYLPSSGTPIPVEELDKLALAPEFSKLPKDRMMSADTYCQLLISRRDFVPNVSGRRCSVLTHTPVWTGPADPVKREHLRREREARRAAAGASRTTAAAVQEKGPRTRTPPVRKNTPAKEAPRVQDVDEDELPIAAAYVDIADWPSEDEDGPNRELGATIEFTKDEISKLSGQLPRLSTKDRKRAVAIILKAEPSINQNEIDLEKIKQRTLFDLDDFYRNCLAMPSRAAELKRKALEERAEAKVRDLEVQTREEAEKRTKENGGASDDNGLVPGPATMPTPTGFTTARKTAVVPHPPPDTTQEEQEKPAPRRGATTKEELRRIGPWRAFHKHTLPEILAAHPDENVKDATSKLREMWLALAPDEKAAWGKLAPPGDSGPGGEDDKDASIEDAGIEAADGAEERASDGDDDERERASDGDDDEREGMFAAEAARKRRRENQPPDLSPERAAKRPAVGAAAMDGDDDDGANPDEAEPIVIDGDATASEEDEEDDDVPIARMVPEGDTTASEDEEDNDVPIARMVPDVDAAKEAQKKAKVPDGWVPPVTAKEVELGKDGRRGAVMIQPLDEHESRHARWRRLRGSAPAVGAGGAETLDSPTVNPNSPKPGGFKIPKRSPGARFDIVNPNAHVYDWDAERIKQRHLDEAKRQRARERAERVEGRGESGDGPGSAAADGIGLFDSTMMDSPPRGQPPPSFAGYPSPGNGVRVSAISVDPRKRRRLRDGAADKAVDRTGGFRKSRWDQPPEDPLYASGMAHPGASLVQPDSPRDRRDESNADAGKKGWRGATDNGSTHRPDSVNTPGHLGRARKGHCAICDGINHKTADCQKRCKNCGLSNHTTARCRHPIACPICFAQGHTADLCAAVRVPGASVEAPGGKQVWCECCRTTSHSLDNCRTKFVPCRHCGQRGHLRKYCPQLKDFESGRPEPLRVDPERGIDDDAARRDHGRRTLAVFNSSDYKRLADEYHKDPRFRENAYPDGPASRANQFSISEVKDHSKVRRYEYNPELPGCKLCRVNFDVSTKCVRETHNRGSGHQAALQRLSSQCKEGGGGVGGSRGDVESFPGTRRDDDDADAVAKEERRRQPASNSPSPTRNAREPGEVGDLARDKTASPSPGRARFTRTGPESPPKVRSPTRDANSPRSPKVGEHAQFGVAIDRDEKRPACPHCKRVHKWSWAKCKRGMVSPNEERLRASGGLGGVMAHRLTPVNSPSGSLRSPRARGGEPPPPETTEPGEMLRCEICNCTVPNGVNGMKIHREGKRHQGMVQLMRL